MSNKSKQKKTSETTTNINNKWSQIPSDTDSLVVSINNNTTIVSKNNNTTNKQNKPTTH